MDVRITTLVGSAAIFLFTAPLVPAQEGAPVPPPTDRAIALAVEKRILLSDQVRSKRLRAEVVDGVVTLAGRVETLFASRRASDIAGEVIGVRSIVNQILVHPAQVSGDRLAANVRDALRAHHAIEAEQVEVVVEDGTVKLSGEVESVGEKTIAEAAVAELAGVREIDNDIEVRFTEERSDAELQEEIDGLLAHSALLDEAKIEVAVDRGVARLEGRVGNLARKRKAIELASIAGIQSVEDADLRIEWRESDGMQRQRRFERLTDETIREAVESGVLRHPLLAGVVDDLDIQVDRGKVTLNGTVHRAALREEVARVARESIGVQGVRNRLRVAWPDEEPSDEEIVETLRKALARDAWLAHAEIIPRSRNAHARLYGVVDTEFEKRRASYMAGMQPGVVHVANYLAVMGEWEPQPDEQIRENLVERLALLESDPHVQVEVVVKDSVPVFTGHVATWFQWQHLLTMAEEVGARRPHLDVSIHYRPTGAGAGLYVPE